jgi:hypothetical protein
MSQRLINHSPDLIQLREERYDIEVRSGHLLVKGVPYVDSDRQVRRGTLVTPLGDISGDSTRPPNDHPAFFTGNHPCTVDGVHIPQFKHSSETKTLAPGVDVNHMFSARPKEGKYRDYHHKMTTYVGIISGPARIIDPGVTAQTGMITPPADDDGPFNYPDTASPRAGIAAVTAKLEGQKIAIVGVGGTGSYVLDLVAKTPVSEIHLFDADGFSNHNAFRSPGAPTIDELNGQPLKTTYFKNQYAKMHRGIKDHQAFVGAQNVEALRGMNFVFMCVDRGPDKRLVIERLVEWGIPFVDTGIGVSLTGDQLRGSVRLTTCTSDKRDHLENRISFGGGGDNDYSKNIQIAELNALNAALAVIRWKKLFGYYLDLDREHCCAYTIDGNTIANEDKT